MPIKRNNKPKTIADETLDRYADKIGKIAEQFMPKNPYPNPNMEDIKPLVFQREISQGLSSLCYEIMEVLDGHTIEDIVNASNVVEQYVKAQSKGGMFTVLPSMYRP